MERSAFSIEYVEKKIIGYAYKLFGWIIIWTMIHLLRTGELWNVWENISLAVKSSGIEPVAWFLFSYTLVLLVAPFFNWLQKKYPIIFALIIAIYVVMIMSGRLDFIRNKDATLQVLQTYIYASYYLLGMLIRILKGKPEICNIVRNISKPSIWVMLILFSITYYLHIFTNDSPLAPDQYYGKWYYTGWLVSIFLCLLDVKVSNRKTIKFLQRLSRNTFTVYMGQMPILLYITSIRPLDSLVSAIICLIAVFTITQLMAELFNHMPLLRKVT